MGVESHEEQVEVVNWVQSGATRERLGSSKRGIGQIGVGTIGWNWARGTGRGASNFGNFGKGFVMIRVVRLPVPPQTCNLPPSTVPCVLCRVGALEGTNKRCKHEW